MKFTLNHQFAITSTIFHLLHLIWSNFH